MPRTVNMHEAKTHLSRLVDEAAAGEEILIARNGRPVARLAALAEDPPRPRRLGTMRGKIWLAPDWDAPDPDIARLFYGDDEDDQP